MNIWPIKSSPVSYSTKSARVRLVVVIPVLTTFFVLSLGLAIMEINRRWILAAGDLSREYIEHSLGIITVAVVIAAAVAFIAGLALAVSVSKSTRMMAERAERIARGDLAGWWPSGNPSGPVPPEFAALSESLDRMAESLNRTMVSGVESGVVVVDREGVVTFANQKAADILGFDFGAVVGRRLEDGALGNRCYRDLTGVARRTLHTRTPVSGLTLTLRNESGKELQLRADTALFRHSGPDGVGVSLRFEDITSMKELGESLRNIESLSGLSGFLEGVAHHIRNPLSSIRGHAQLMKENAGENCSEIPEGIINNVDIIDSVIQSFLEEPEREMNGEETRRADSRAQPLRDIQKGA